MKTNYEIRYAANPTDAKQYDTARLRHDFLIETLFSKDEVNMVYSMYDRMIVGGAMPVNEPLPLEAIDPLKAPFFLTRREIGIFNVGQGEGRVYVGDKVFTLGFSKRLSISDEAIGKCASKVSTATNLPCSISIQRQHIPPIRIRKSPKQTPLWLTWALSKAPTNAISTR